LAARTAWRSERRGVGDDRDTRERAMSFRNRLEHRDSLCANRQPVRRVLDIAPGDYRAVGRFKSGADFEIREPRVRVFARTPRGGGKIDVPGPAADPSRAEAALPMAAICFLRRRLVRQPAIES